MKTRTVTTRLSAIVLAMAASACAPRASFAQDATPAPAELPAPPAQPAEPVAVEGAATQPSEQHRLHVRQNEMQNRAAELRREASAVARANADIARANSELARAKDFHFRNELAIRTHSPDTPLVITTQPMDAAAQTEWREDLTVMDKLVREEVARTGAAAPSAMGITLTILGQSAPMYVEGAGVVLHASVNWPLAPVGAAGGKTDDRPRDPASKWDQVKRELSGYSLPKLGKAGEPPQLPVFDAAKLEALRSTLLKVLPEATNFRHLKENESVFITILGIDDGGAPVRMTVKASKADIDAAAAGKLTPEEFAQRVAQRIG